MKAKVTVRISLKIHSFLHMLPYFASSWIWQVTSESLKTCLGYSTREFAKKKICRNEKKNLGFILLAWTAIKSKTWQIENFFYNVHKFTLSAIINKTRITERWKYFKTTEVFVMLCCSFVIIFQFELYAVSGHTSCVLDFVLMIIVH